MLWTSVDQCSLNALRSFGDSWQEGKLRIEAWVYPASLAWLEADTSVMDQNWSPSKRGLIRKNKNQNLSKSKCLKH